MLSQRLDVCEVDYYLIQESERKEGKNMKMTIYLSLILTAIMPSLAKSQEPVYFADAT